MRRIRRSSLRYSVVKVLGPDRLGLGGGPARVRSPPLVGGGPREITWPRDTTARHILRRAACAWRMSLQSYSVRPTATCLKLGSTPGRRGRGGDSNPCLLLCKTSAPPAELHPQVEPSLAAPARRRRPS